MTNFKNRLASLALAACLLAVTALPAPAAITFVTRGQAKVGGIILGSTTLTPTGTEINTLANEIATVSQVSTPASGTNGTQFTFKNAAGATVSAVRGMTMYYSTSAGVPTTAATGFATLTNGVVVTLVTGSVGFVTCSAAGLLGVTVTDSAGAHYLSFVLPNGKVITSTVLTVN